MSKHYRLDVSPPKDCANGSLFIAVKIARRFREKEPTVPSLMDVFGMSRATAYRWVAAWKAANGLA